jgi:D-alanyl-D-alanine dipeptidase
MLIIVSLASALKSGTIAQPQRYVSLGEYIPGIKIDARYYAPNNFTGAPLPGYLAPKVLLLRQAADSLILVREYLNQQGYGLKVFDGYRPQKAVNAFVKWAQAPGYETKEKYYPDVPKDSLFPQGYIAKKSGHSRGSTVDLTLVLLSTGKELDMGTPFDYFGPESHPLSPLISEKARQNRLILRRTMVAFGFKPLHTEWWHFTLNDEPYPDTYFDFDIE